MGSGFPVVLLPKLGGWIADWRHVAPILAQEYSIIAIDNPGHGDSILEGPPPYLQSVIKSAHMLMAILDELGVGRCALAGNSLGGIASIMAGLWPAKFSKLILLRVALGSARTREDMEEQDKRNAELYDAEDRPRPRSLEDVAKAFGLHHPDINNEMYQSHAKAGAWVRATERGAVQSGGADYLSRMTASTLLMYGTRGGCKKFEAMGLSKISKAKLVHIADASSFAHQDQPVITAKTMMEFLAL